MRCSRQGWLTERLNVGKRLQTRLIRGHEGVRRRGLKGCHGPISIARPRSQKGFQAAAASATKLQLKGPRPSKTFKSSCELAPHADGFHPESLTVIRQ